LSTHQPLVINGWNIFAHPLFLNQFEELLKQVEGLRQKYPNDYKQKNAAKRLAAIAKLAFDVIPQDPTRSEYRQGRVLSEPMKAIQMPIEFLKRCSKMVTLQMIGMIYSKKQKLKLSV